MPVAQEAVNQMKVLQLAHRAGGNWNEWSVLMFVVVALIVVNLELLDLLNDKFCLYLDMIIVS